jgi:hypothetical protein
MVLTLLQYVDWFKSTALVICRFGDREIDALLPALLELWISWGRNLNGR